MRITDAPFSPDEEKIILYNFLSLNPSEILDKDHYSYYQGREG